jgi:5'-deoxynucleotidase YfbR-like HD superfamily hydrolase
MADGGRLIPAPSGAPLAAFLPLLRELGDLKRVHSAAAAGSIAERLFHRAWSALVAGHAPDEVALAATRHALAAARLGDLDKGVLAEAGVPADAIHRIEAAAVAEVSGLLAPGLRERLAGAGALPPCGAVPPFVERLARQPRAGATCPGRGRLMFEPPENHAEHCMVTALNAVVLAPLWDADPAEAFLAAMAHHLHNALLPDSGFAGEMLLGEWLVPAMDRATALALAELPEPLRVQLEQARRILPDAGMPGGRAFHAADTLDRVLQMEHHLRAAGTSMAFILREMELVHAGPVKPFQDDLLARMELAA